MNNFAFLIVACIASRTLNIAQATVAIPNVLNSINTDWDTGAEITLILLSGGRDIER